MPDTSAGARLRRAGQLVSERRLAEAEVEIVEALAEVPDDLRGHKLLALVRFRLGRLVQARESYRRVVQAAPQDAAARLNLGLIALKLERFEEAAEELAVAVRLRPDDARTLAYLGHAQARLGQATEAASDRILDQPREEAPAEPQPAGQPLTAFVHARLLDTAAPGAAPASAGVYRLPLATQACVQSACLLAVVGEIAVEPARRRQRGQVTAAPLAAPAGAFLFCRGTGELWLTPSAPAGSLDALDLEEDVLFVREASVLAFSGDLVWESGAIPRSDVRLLHLSGTGRVVVDWAAREVVALRLSQGRPLTVSADRLCGWIGHLAIDPAPGAMVGCEGEGVLLIARNGQAGERIHQRAEPGHDGAGLPHPGGAVLHR
jgi:hypothetical protein